MHKFVILILLSLISLALFFVAYMAVSLVITKRPFFVSHAYSLVVVAVVSIIATGLLSALISMLIALEQKTFFSSHKFYFALVCIFGCLALVSLVKCFMMMGKNLDLDWSFFAWTYCALLGSIALSSVCTFLVVFLIGVYTLPVGSILPISTDQEITRQPHGNDVQ